jgi:hypothetical protein
MLSRHGLVIARAKKPSVTRRLDSVLRFCYCLGVGVCYRLKPGYLAALLQNVLAERRGESL